MCIEMWLWTGRRPLEPYETSGEGGGGASDAGLGGGEGDVGVLPVLPRRLFDQTVVLHLRGRGLRRLSSSPVYPLVITGY